MVLLKRFCAVLGAAVLALPAFGWDDSGHTTIGIIAYNQLDSGQKKRLVDVLNRGDFLFRIDPAAEAFSVGKTATWADHIKGNTDGGFESEIEQFNNWAYPAAARGSDREGTRCRVWHYKNIILFGEGRQQRVKLAPFDAVKAVNLARSRYGTELTERMKAFWLYWLMHVVGDLHQPLHCVASVEFDPSGDAGGNKFLLTGDVKNLHWLWDNGISDGMGVAGWRGGLVEKAAEIQKRHPRIDFGARINELDPDGWCKEGATNALSVVYQGIRPNDVPSEAYNKKRTDLSLKQAALAGYRLGEVLKGLLGD